MIEKIQYLKGPASVLYGEGSPGGLVNLVTKQPMRQDRYEVSVLAGSYDLLRLTGDATGPLSESGDLLYRSVFAYETFAAASNNDELRVTAMPMLSWFVTPDLLVSGDVELYYEKQRGQRNAIAPGFDINQIRESFHAANPGDKWWNYNISPSIRLDYQLDSGWGLHSNLRVTEIVADYDYHTATAYDPASKLVSRKWNRGYYDWWEYQSDSFADGSVLMGTVEHKIVVGTELSRSTESGWFTSLEGSSVDIDNPNYSSLTKPDKQENSKAYTNRYGLYLQDQIHWSSNWITLLSARWDEVTLTDKDYGTPSNKVTHKAISPRIGIVFKPDDTAALFVSSGESFQAPWVGAYLEDGSRPDPIVTQSLEAGVKSDLWQNKLALSLTAFAMRRKGELQWAADSFYTQVGEADSRGVESELIGNILPSWQIKFAHAFLQTKIKRDQDNEGNQLPLAPKHHLSLWNNVELFKNYEASLGLVQTAKRFNNNANEAEFGSLTRMDAGINYSKSGTRASLFCENITDRKYFLNAWDQVNAVLGARRSLSLQLSYEI